MVKKCKSSSTILDEILIFIILTIITITITKIIIWQRKSIWQKISYKISSWLKERYYNKHIINPPNINSAKDKKEHCKQELGKIRRQVRDSFDKGDIMTLKLVN